jgi:hypothetical protein
MKHTNHMSQHNNITTNNKATHTSIWYAASHSHHRLASDECSCILDIEAFLHGSGRIVALPTGTLASRRESVCRDAAVFSGPCWVVGAATADPRLQVPQQGSQEALGADNEARQKGILQGKGINEGGILDEQGEVRAGPLAAPAIGGPGLDGLQGTHAVARNPENAWNDACWCQCWCIR